MHRSLSIENKKILLSQLQTHMTAPRIELINKVLESRTDHFTLVLEDLYQGRNASAILRNADCFGIQTYHTVENQYKFNPSKDTSMSANKWLDQTIWSEEKQDNIGNCLTHLKKQGYKICATTLRPGALPINELPIDQPLALCFGTELTGLTEQAHQHADYLTYIPMNGFIQSMNVSVASAIIMNKLSERLLASNLDWGISEEDKLQLRIEWSLGSITRSESVLEYYMKQLRLTQ
jgi:tRNA (guanosine-2'-O-)-methyltransferase